MVYHNMAKKEAEYMTHVDLKNLDSLPLHVAQMEKMAAIGQLSSSVAHEMRNLLGMIRTAAFNIGRATRDEDSAVHNNLEIINRSVIRAKEFIDNLLNLSRIPRGKEEQVDICRVVDNLLNLFSKELEWRAIELKRSYRSLSQVYIDCQTLQECLLNLILNAIQSMEKGGRITVGIEPWEQGVKLCVEDTGCGIPAKDLERIFDQFYTTKKDGQGTGLGLTIARNLVQEIGGGLFVKSHLGKGSRFSLCFPCRRSTLHTNTEMRSVHVNQRNIHNNELVKAENVLT